MKKLLYIIVAIFTTFLFSCQDESNVGTLTVNFKANYGGNPFRILDSYDWVNNTKIRFLDENFYIANVTLGSNTLSDHPKLIQIGASYINYNNDGISVTFQNVPVGNYSAIKFGIGVPTDLNAKTPSDFVSSDDLSKTSHYWEAWNSYIFSKLEGNADLDNDGIYESSFTYHTGRDDMYRTLNFTKDLSIVSDSDTKVGFNLDVKKLLVNANNEALDIVLHPDSHTPSQIGTATIIMDNYQNAISLQ